MQQRKHGDGPISMYTRIGIRWKRPLRGLSVSSLPGAPPSRERLAVIGGQLTQYIKQRHHNTLIQTLVKQQWTLKNLSIDTPEKQVLRHDGKVVLILSQDIWRKYLKCMSTRTMMKALRSSSTRTHGLGFARVFSRSVVSASMSKTLTDSIYTQVS
jgi:hypothetical protein